MTTASGAYGVIQTILEGGKPVALTAGYRWQNETGEPLPDEPAPFAFVEFNAMPTSSPKGFGGGQGRNLYRNEAWVTVFVFVPKGLGLKPSTDLAEALAALFRSYRDADISCHAASALPGGDGASIKPPGLDSDVGNYFFAVAEIGLHFDQIG